MIFFLLFFASVLKQKCQFLYFYNIILVIISLSPPQPPSSDKKPLFLLVLPSPAFHLLLSWKDKDQKINNGNYIAAFSLQFHFPFLKSSRISSVGTREDWCGLGLAGAAGLPKFLLSKAHSPLWCEEPGEPRAVLPATREESQKFWEDILWIYIQTFPAFQSTPTGINACQWVTG